MKVCVKEKELPILDQCDVAVIGGGVAGIAAALSAARQGAKVILVEKQCVLGGLATSGLVTIYLPLCDGRGHQVSFGIAEELFRMSVTFGAQRKYPTAWLENGTLEEKTKKRFEVQFNPVYFQLLAEQKLREAGVKILYDTAVYQVIRDGRRIKAVIVETVEGRMVLQANGFVDASGDARVFWMAGEKTRRYEKGNILAAWYYFCSGGKLELNMLGTVEQSDYMAQERHVAHPLSKRRFYGEEVQEVNDFLQMAHQQMLQDMKKKHEGSPEFEPALIPGMPQYRMTRCVEGRCILRGDQHSIEQNDSIGMVADWRRRGYIYEIPYGCLYVDGLDNVLAAGRNISVDDEMWDVSRVIPACAVTGEAAGIAAARAHDHLLSAEEVQSELKLQGQVLHLCELQLGEK